MANNRMVLVCNVCVPKKDEWDYSDKFKDKILILAKWYPAVIKGGDGSYYSNDNFESLPDRLNKFLVDHQHKEVGSKDYTAGAGQENPVRIEYESEGLPIIKEEEL